MKSQSSIEKSNDLTNLYTLTYEEDGFDYVIQNGIQLKRFDDQMNIIVELFRKVKRKMIFLLVFQIETFLLGCGFH